VSKVATWVQGTDGQYYKNPEIEKDGFFICFDDEEDPEIVIEIPTSAVVAGTKLDRPSCYRRAADLLKSLNVPYRITDYGTTCQRIFGEYQFRYAYSVYFRLKGPLPVEIITKHEGRANKPKGECTFIHFTGALP
jgi:hypothetical protein